MSTMLLWVYSNCFFFVRSLSLSLLFFFVWTLFNELSALVILFTIFRLMLWNEQHVSECIWYENNANTLQQIVAIIVANKIKRKKNFVWMNEWIFGRIVAYKSCATSIWIAFSIQLHRQIIIMATTRAITLLLLSFTFNVSIIHLSAS